MPPEWESCGSKPRGFRRYELDNGTRIVCLSGDDHFESADGKIESPASAPFAQAPRKRREFSGTPAHAWFQLGTANDLPNQIVFGRQRAEQRYRGAARIALEKLDCDRKRFAGASFDECSRILPGFWLNRRQRFGFELREGHLRTEQRQLFQIGSYRAQVGFARGERRNDAWLSRDVQLLERFLDETYARIGVRRGIDAQCAATCERCEALGFRAAPHDVEIFQYERVAFGYVLRNIPDRAAIRRAERTEIASHDDATLGKKWHRLHRALEAPGVKRFRRECLEIEIALCTRQQAIENRVDGSLGEEPFASVDDDERPDLG